MSESQTWYRVHSYTVKIEPVQVVQFTAKSVVTLDTWCGKVQPTRHMRKLEYFPTYEQARAHLIENYTRGVASAKTSLQYREDELKKAKALPETV